MATGINPLASRIAQLYGMMAILLRRCGRTGSFQHEQGATAQSKQLESGSDIGTMNVGDLELFARTAESS